MSKEPSPNSDDQNVGGKNGPNSNDAENSTTETKRDDGMEYHHYSDTNTNTNPNTMHGSPSPHESGSEDSNHSNSRSRNHSNSSLYDMMSLIERTHMGTPKLVPANARYNSAGIATPAMTIVDMSQISLTSTRPNSTRPNNSTPNDINNNDINDNTNIVVHSINDDLNNLITSNSNDNLENDNNNNNNNTKKKKKTKNKNDKNAIAINNITIDTIDENRHSAPNVDIETDNINNNINSDSDNDNDNNDKFDNGINDSKNDLNRQGSSIGASTSNLKLFFSSRHILFYCPTMKTIAQQLEKESNGRIILGSIDWKCFADGFPDLKIHNAYNIRWSDVSFLADISHPARIFEQYSVMCEIPRLLARSFKIIMPFFPTAQMERVENYGQIATAKTLARLLSSVPHCANGPCQICICDIHTLQNQFYFSDKILMRLETCIPLLLQAIIDKFGINGWKKSVSIAFPDAGAQKRFGKFFMEFPQIICHKRRGENDKRIVVLKEGKVKDRDVIIVDDLVQTGGTLANCAALLKKEGCKSVMCYCTHGVFPNQAWKRFCEKGKNEGLFETFWVTNTIPWVASELSNKKPFKVLSMVPVLRPVIYDNDQVMSVEC